MALMDRVKTDEYTKRRALVMAELQVGIASQLFNRRVELGLTEDHVASVMGSTQPKVSEFERGEANATFDYVARYAASVGLMPVIKFEPQDQLPTDQDE